MNYYRFDFVIAGSRLFGLAFASERELEAFLAGSGAVLAKTLSPATRLQVDEEPGPRGRPSFDELLGNAVDALGAEIDRCATLRSAARLVQRAMARDGDANSVPSSKTIERFLAEHRPRRAKGQKGAQKWGQKSKDARISRNGGT